MKKIFSFRVEAALAKDADKILKMYGSNKSEFIQACIKGFLENPEEFLKRVGFHKKEVWVKRRR
jgi:hypothetical protein